MDIKDKIYQRRKELGLTLEEVGKIVGVGKSTVRKWETGDIENMRTDKIELLAKALQVTPAFIMGWEDKVQITNCKYPKLLEITPQNMEKYKPYFNIVWKGIDETIFTNEDAPPYYDMETGEKITIENIKKFSNERKCAILKNIVYAIYIDETAKTIQIFYQTDKLIDLP